eukprot:gnl/MRDRNA2_/MRDRNA2_30578_c0_seq1.p1 gnl/MRDRNA2_/MRDRNA2_30578_c0~~gnl/MRDRNA2_/MRDRNA2_30578_c0_seq1.p1  ORF type:complete len:271 (+),score=55.30 gnl/MRDRNA2_/MRDRNA2_30578_c0_seq1:154-966(+)
MNRGAVLVTGAASGIGRACASVLATRGWRVALTDVQEQKGQAVASEILSANPDSQAKFYTMDVCSEEQTHAVVQQVVKDFGKLGGAAAIAGVSGALRPFLETTLEDFEHVLGANLKGTFITGQAVSRAMVAQGSRGSIVNMSSVNSKLVLPGQAGYATSKGGVQQLTRLMALELAPHGIRVNSVGPGSVNTEMVMKAYGDPEPVPGIGLTKMQLMLARTPLGRMAEPEEIAKIVAFLLSDDASYVTGEAIICDGARANLNGAVPIPYGTL